MTQSICNTILLNHCCCNFVMLPDTFMELVWKLQLLQMFVAVLWPPCFGDNTSMFDTHLNGLLLHGHFLPLQIKNRCCNVPLTLGASIRESKRCAFYSSHVPDGNHSRPPRCQCTKANDEAATVAIVTGASIFKFQRNSWVCFICSLVVNIKFVADACFFFGICFEGVCELILIQCKYCLWTLSGWNLSWKVLVLMWGHVAYMLSVWCLMLCSFCGSCPHRVHILPMLANGWQTLLTQGKFSD